MKRKVIIFFIAVLITTVFFGCRDNSAGKGSDNDGQQFEDNKEAAQPSNTPPGSNEAGLDDEDNKEDDDPVNDEVERLIATMTLEEKVGQVFFSAFRRGADGKLMHQLDESSALRIKSINPGGMVLFSENIDNIEQTVKLIEDMQAASKIPLFMAVDEEGGRISRLNTSKRMHATQLPGNELLGRTGDVDLAYEVGVLLGTELSSLGFNMNFAPVADVNTNPENPIIGSRAFGANPEEVAVMVEAVMRGIKDTGVCPVLKHFPGHGDTSADTHTGAVVIKHDMDRLQKVEFIPFVHGIQAGADAIMTAHIHMPGITDEDVPATMSSKILEDILREKMGFEGLIITDGLEMGAIIRHWSSGEASVKAFEAGADILLLPHNLEEAFNGLYEAVKNGRITETRLDESVKRILKVKSSYKILNPTRKYLDPELVLGCEKHMKIAQDIVQKADEKD